MADATFDGPNLYVTLPSIGAFDTQTNIYSAWKEWVRQGDNAKYYPAFDAVGGDEVGSGQSVAPYFFCRNDLGWRIKMPEANGEITVSGNLFARDPSLPLFEQTQGFDAFLRLTVSTRAVVVEVGTSGLTASESSKLAAIPSNPLLTTDERIGTSTESGPSLADFSRAVQSAIPDPASPSAIWDSAPKWMKKPPSKTKDYSDAIRSLSNKIDTLYQSFDAVKRQPEPVAKEGFDVARLEQQIQGLSDAINAIEIPNGEEGFASLRSLVEPIQGGLDGIKSEIFGVREDISSIPEIDLSAVSKQDSMDEALEALEDAIARIRNYDDTQIKRLLKSVIANTESLTDDISVVEQKADLVLDNQMRQP